MPDAPKPKKQAVIVVHGMGEQRPMETLRSFVTAVWETDEDGTIPAEIPDERRTWIVPDRRNGILDLSRITTRRNEDGVRTDFFELYWADIFTGNTLQQLSGWVRGLLLRWPVQVPRDVFWAWVLLWGLSIFAAAALAYVMVSGGNPLKLFNSFEWGINRDPAVFHWSVSGALAGATALFMQGRLAAVMKDNRVDPFSQLSQALVFAVPAALFLALVYFAPWNLIAEPKFWLAAMALAVVWLIRSVVVPYLGDVARYTQNAPWAIDARAKIRARGLGLLRELHGKSADGREPAAAGEYQRIIVVGHSLGSVVAYDLLRYYWAEAGPVGKNLASAETMGALSEVDTYLKLCFDEKPESPARKAFTFSEYSRLQTGAGEAMSAFHDAWKISDFVTLGCPLSHAEFLIANDRPQFEQMVKELVLPASVPVRDVTRGSFLYDPKYRGKGSTPADKRADHGAVFAATRWTNICDPARNIVSGDFISGLLTENFGRGVNDIAVSIRVKRRWLGWWGSALFTHTQYWNAKACGEKAPAGDARPGPEPPDENRRDHILALKAALGLGKPMPLTALKSRSAPAAIHPAPADTSRPKSPRADTISRPS
jgi:hypothetical protein